MRILAEMLQEFSELCQKYPQKHMISLYNHYFKTLNEEEAKVADCYYYWFIMVGDAVRDEHSFLNHNSCRNP